MFYCANKAKKILVSKTVFIKYLDPLKLRKKFK